MIIIVMITNISLVAVVDKDSYDDQDAKHVVDGNDNVVDAGDVVDEVDYNSVSDDEFCSVVGSALKREYCQNCAAHICALGVRGSMHVLFRCGTSPKHPPKKREFR